MSTAARSASTRRGRRDKYQYLIGALVLLAVVATVLSVVFSGNTRLLLLAVVAALWAAVIGSIASIGSRREATTARARAHDLKTVYDLELEREVTARRMYEYQVERTVREEIRASSSSEVAELRDELRALRESLAALLGGELMVERVALHAESTRLRSLSDTARMAAGGPEALEHRRDVEDAVVEDEPAEPFDVTRTGEPSAEGRPDESVGSTERTDVIPKIAGESGAEPLVAERDPEPETVRARPDVQPPPAPTAHAPIPAGPATTPTAEPSVAASSPVEPVPAQPPPAAEGGRRRRRDERVDEPAVVAPPADADGAAGSEDEKDDVEGAHSAGRSVSDLIAAYGAGGGAATGRRRRAD